MVQNPSLEAALPAIGNSSCQEVRSFKEAVCLWVLPGGIDVWDLEDSKKALRSCRDPKKRLSAAHPRASCRSHGHPQPHIVTVFANRVSADVIS